jgi:hypothetical protein
LPFAEQEASNEEGQFKNEKRKIKIVGSWQSVNGEMKNEK